MRQQPPSLEDRKRMSFRAAEDGTDMPAALRWGELDQDLRLQLWDAFHALLMEGLMPNQSWFHVDFWDGLARVLRTHSKVPIDEAREQVEWLSGAIGVFKPILLKAPYSEALDLIQCTLREIESSAFVRNVEVIFSDPRSPYDLDGPPPTIIPKGNEIEGHSVANDLRAIRQSELSGARSHLLAAADALNRADNRGAIREAIHAVESAAKRVSGRENAILSDALNALEKEKGLHPALKEAFKKLYGYTSDEKGIRHALLDEVNKDVGIDEALFMFSACAAFVSYLARKFPEQDVAG